MTLDEKIADAEQKVRNAQEQKEAWTRDHLIFVGRLQTLVEMKQEEEAAQAAEKKLAEDAAKEPQPERLA